MKKLRFGPAFFVGILLLSGASTAQSIDQRLDAIESRLSRIEQLLSGDGDPSAALYLKFQELIQLEMERLEIEIARLQSESQEQDKAEAQESVVAVERDENDAEIEFIGRKMGAIQDTIQQNWVIPPSARNGMFATVEIRTTPIGDIVSTQIIESSNDRSFDRSVLQAVSRVDSLPELRDMPNVVYERSFRKITLKFMPMDLLR